MKELKTIVILVMLACSTSLSAQHLKDGCAWVYYNWYENEAQFNEPEYIKYELCGTQELNGKTYYKLYSTTSYFGMIGETKYEFGLREEDGRVYVDYGEYLEAMVHDVDPNADKNTIEAMPYLITDDNEVILYDYNLNAGDYVGHDDILLKRYINKKYSIRMETGEERTLFEVNCRIGEPYNIDGPFCTVIEGIGSIDAQGGLFNWMNDLFGTELVMTCLNVFVDNNTIIYKAPDYTGAPEDEGYSYTTYRKDPFFGHLVTGIGSVKSDAGRDVKPCLYDLSGRKVEGKPRPGVYICGGKKVVVK